MNTTLEAKCAEMREAQIKFPDNLSALTVGLVLSFAQAMADKLSAAQIKHGYGDGWAETTHEWPIPECHEALMSHLKKGDPVDAANFCAFLWYHKIGTTDCGKGWHSPKEWDELQAKCEMLREALTRIIGSCEYSPCSSPHRTAGEFSMGELLQAQRALSASTPPGSAKRPDPASPHPPAAPPDPD